VRPVDEIDAADEEREVRMRAARNGAPVGEELRPAGAVERHDDVLRTAHDSDGSAVNPVRSNDRFLTWSARRPRPGEGGYRAEARAQNE